MSWNDHEPMPRRAAPKPEPNETPEEAERQEKLAQDALAQTLAALEPLAPRRRKRVVAAVQAYFQDRVTR